MTPPPQFFILGASGDLTARKLIPALASLARQGREFSVLGLSRSPKTDEIFRAELRARMPDELLDGFDTLAPRIGYQSVDLSEAGQVEALRERAGAGGRLFYLALKPELFGSTVEALCQSGLLCRGVDESHWQRVVVEKPFGHDLASARRLNAELHKFIDEEQLYRIDHYLGKETVQNLLGFRFHNAIFDPLWSRHHVELVQITVAEELGLGGRAGYYDTTGAVRDMLQNHMLQILALIAMEPPATLAAESIRNQKVAVLRGLHLHDVGHNSVRARYTARGDTRGYLEEEGVATDSMTETYVAARAEVATWRWSGVPFLLRHGKRLPRKNTEVRIQFRTAPLQLFNRPEGMSEPDFRAQLEAGNLCQVRPNVLTLTLQPREAIGLSFGVKRPGNVMQMTPAELSFDYRDQFGETTAPAYERLLLDALLGDQTLFLRSDEIDASWRFADELRGGWDAAGAPMHEYAAGSWGPSAADDLFYGCEGGWGV
ncbi:MAG: glucose-6-phosphate dehydrogenase [bacterium]|nr:glucose-6-phosphate dehydrogenase [bacterium]